jgi:putative YhdH/YhfP family quinone oxidoreductase
VKESTTFPALVIRQGNNGSFVKNIEERQIEELPAGDVLIAVDYSSLNYKDALSASGNRGVTKKYPHTPGIDAAGVVAESTVKAFRPDDAVIVSGYDLGMNTPGGFGRYVRVPANWVMHRPSSLSALRCMQIGTAGFTAAQSVLALRTMGVRPDQGPSLVTGATGGVGCIAVALLKQSGFSVVAASGKKEEYPLLQKLGAEDFLNREQAAIGADRMLLRERWAGVVDTVGGQILATAIKSTKYDGTVTCCGNAASGELPLNVYPFILRGVKLVGIDSAQCPMQRRKEIWQILADECDMQFLDTISSTVKLAELGSVIDQMLAGSTRGRTVIDLREGA